MPARVRRTSTSTSPQPTSTGDLAGRRSLDREARRRHHPLLTDWLTRFAEVGAKITLRPVLDLASDGRWTSTTHPTAMRETVVLRDAHCVFPGCRRDSRACDLDHITEYLPLEDGGPPGQTHPGNLAPLCRTHHRVKTHSPWRYKRLDHGTYTWTAPPATNTTSPPTPRLTRRT